MCIEEVRQPASRAGLENTEIGGSPQDRDLGQSESVSACVRRVRHSPCSRHPGQRGRALPGSGGCILPLQARPRLDVGMLPKGRVDLQA